MDDVRVSTSTSCLLRSSLYSVPRFSLATTLAYSTNQQRYVTPDRPVRNVNVNTSLVLGLRRFVRGLHKCQQFM